MNTKLWDIQCGGELEVTIAAETPEEAVREYEDYYGVEADSLEVEAIERDSSCLTDGSTAYHDDDGKEVTWQQAVEQCTSLPSIVVWWME